MQIMQSFFFFFLSFERNLQRNVAKCELMAAPLFCGWSAFPPAGRDMMDMRRLIATISHHQDT